MRLEDERKEIDMFAEIIRNLPESKKLRILDILTGMAIAEQVGNQKTA